MKWRQVVIAILMGLASVSLIACSTQKNSKGSNEIQQGVNSLSVTPASDGRYRTVITTDGEVDDMNSMIRYLYYANEMKLEARQTHEESNAYRK